MTLFTLQQIRFVKPFLSTLLALFFTVNLAAQMPQLVRDIRLGSTGSIPIYLAGEFTTEGATVGNYFYFTANDGTNGVELWRTDGTEMGTQMVKDINAGNGSSSPRYLTTFGDRLLFFANDGALGYELWISDGTENGTQLVKDINVGAADGVRTGYAPQFDAYFVLNGVFYFAADSDGEYAQLWRSNGTEAGTYKIKSVCPTCTANSGSTSWFTALNNTLYFIAEGDLWKSNGIGVGTTKITDDNNANAPKKPAHLRAAGGKLYFAAEKNSVVDVDLWVSNGTTAGTQLLKDIAPGDFSGSFPRDFTFFKNKVYFVANQSVWVTDGTANGTVQFSNLEAGNYQHELGNGFNLFVANDLLFFNARGPGGGSQEYLYTTDGTPGNIVQIAETNDYGFLDISLIQYQNKICFWGEKDNERGIWITNGTATGKLFVPTITSVVPGLWIAGDDLFLFYAPLSPNIGRELFKISLAASVPLAFTINQTDDIACAGEQTAALLVDVSTGTPPYEYKWSNPALQGPSPGNLGAGTYTLTITDAALEASIQSFTITAPAALNATAQVTPATGSASNGSAIVTASGGTGPYTYLWNTGATTDSLTSVPAGAYSVVITDGKGCMKTLDVTIQMISANSNLADAQLKVYPTLCRGLLQVDWTGVPLNKIRLEVIDNQGIVHRTWDELPSNMLQITDLPMGHYWLRLRSGGVVAQQKFILIP